MNWEKHYSGKPYVGQKVTTDYNKYTIVEIHPNGRLDVKFGNDIYVNHLPSTFNEFRK